MRVDRRATATSWTRQSGLKFLAPPPHSTPVAAGREAPVCPRARRLWARSWRHTGPSAQAPLPPSDRRESSIPTRTRECNSQTRPRPKERMFCCQVVLLHHCSQVEPSLYVSKRSQPRAPSRLLWLLWACPGDSALLAIIGRIEHFRPRFCPRNRPPGLSFSDSIGLLQSVR